MFFLACKLQKHKVCRADNEFVKRVLEFYKLDAFLQFCNVFEFFGYSINELDSLIDDICDVIGNNDPSTRTKCQSLRFCHDLHYRLQMFDFSENNTKGIMNFGLLVVIRSGEVINAACFVFSMQFAVAPNKVTATTRAYLHGREITSTSQTWTEPENLGFLTKESLLNFGWLKALEELKLRGIIANINDVASIGATELSPCALESYVCTA